MFRTYSSRILLALLALVICSGTLQAAATLSTAQSAGISITCDTVLGPGDPVPVNIALAASTVATQTVTATVTAGTSPTTAITIVTSSATVSQSGAVPFKFNMNAGCKNATDGGTVNLVFTPSPAGSTAAITVVATLHVNGGASAPSALAISPGSVTVTCTRAAGSPVVYTPGPAQTVNITSPANGGTPFTVDQLTADVPSWLTLGGAAIAGGNTASVSPIALTLQAKAGCGALPPGTTSGTINLQAPPAVNKVLTVYIQVGVASTLTSTPISMPALTMSYTKVNNAAVAATTMIGKSGGNDLFFAIDTSSLPIWMTASPVSGSTATTPMVTFLPNSAAGNLAPGTYNANVHFKVSGALDFVITVFLQVSNPSATLSTAEGQTPPAINWTIGTATPSVLITPISSDTPIPFTVTVTNGTLYPVVSEQSGIALSFGSPFYVTFQQSVLSAAAPTGDGNPPLTGTVTLNYGSGQIYTVTLVMNVISPASSIPTIIGASPSSLPTATTGSFPVVLTGTGFSTGSINPATVVGVLVGANVVTDPNIGINVTSNSSIVVTIHVPASPDVYLPFSGNGGPVTLAVCNPQAGATACAASQSTYTIQIGTNPVIQAVTSASSFLQATPPALTSIAPYDIVSVFGTNFCVSGGTGCITPNPAVLYGKTDPATLRYLTQLGPVEVAGATQRYVTAGFWSHGSSPKLIAYAPLLFVTNNQINLLVPSAVDQYYGKTVDIIVSFGYTSLASNTMLVSVPYSVAIAATNPGVFVMTGDGQGDAAALTLGNVPINSALPAGLRGTTATDSDVVQLYVTGLGEPDSTDSAVSWGTTFYCAATGTYLSEINSASGLAGGQTLTTLDGLVIQSALTLAASTPATAPCFKSTANSGTHAPTVTVGGVSAPVTYAGWVPDSVAGLYQIDVQLPPFTGSTFKDWTGNNTIPVLSTPTALPIVVTSGSVKSQISGVNLWVNKTLKMTAVAGVTAIPVSGTATLSTVTATGGTSYNWTVNSDSPLGGLTIAGGVVSFGSTALPGTYNVTVTASDTIDLTLRGVYTFSVTLH